MGKFINRFAAVAALTLAATPIIGLGAAHAGERAPQVARIRVGDLTLSRPADAAEFVRRAELAANEVCAARTAREQLRGLAVRACVMDFNFDLRAEMTPAQRADLKAARQAQPSLFATRSMGLF